MNGDTKFIVLLEGFVLCLELPFDHDWWGLDVAAEISLLRSRPSRAGHRASSVASNRHGARRRRRVRGPSAEMCDSLSAKQVAKTR